MKRGFTLLEVLVSVAILGLGLTAILSAQAGAFASAAHARHISAATGLLRCKMSEVEEHLYKDGFQDTDETGTGPCCETNEDPPNMKCTWRVDRPQFPEAKFGDLNLSSALNFGGAGAGGPSGPMGALGMLSGAAGPASPLGTATSISDIAKTLADANAQALNPAGSPPLDPSLSSSSGFPSLAPSGAPSGSPMPSPSGIPGSPDLLGGGGGDAGLGGLASIAMSFVYPSLKILFEASTRRITATLTFREGKKEYSIDVVEWFAIPQLGLAPSDDSVTDSTPATGSTGKPGAVPSPISPVSPISPGGHR